MLLVVLTWLLAVVVVPPPVLVSAAGSVSTCIKAVASIIEEDVLDASGTERVSSGPGSCMSCDPALPACPDACWNKIDFLYRDCDEVCLPDGFYFDPAEEIGGCWDDYVDLEIKVAVERCGCNDVAGKAQPVWFVNALVSFFAVVWLRQE